MLDYQYVIILFVWYSKIKSRIVKYSNRHRREIEKFMSALPTMKMLIPMMTGSATRPDLSAT